MTIKTERRNNERIKDLNLKRGEERRGEEEYCK